MKRLVRRKGGWAAVAGKKRKKKKPAGEAGRCLAVSLLLMGLLFLLLTEQRME